MKTILILAIFLALTFGEQYLTITSYTMNRQCSFQDCQFSTWTFNNTNYGFACPKQYNSYVIFDKEQENYVIKFASGDKTTYVPIRLNYHQGYPQNYTQKSTSNGIEFYADLDQGHQFVILDCSIPESKKISSLCKNHDFVCSKIINNTFQDSCSFSIDRARYKFLQKEMPLEIQF